jgi:hypothetical protein
LKAEAAVPRWIHQRAEHLLATSPAMPKSMAFAIATEQAKRSGHLEEPKMKKRGSLEDEIRKLLGETSPASAAHGARDKTRGSVKGERERLFHRTEAPSKLGAAEFNGFVDELVSRALGGAGKTASPSPSAAGSAAESRAQKFVSGVKGEFFPAAGAIVGAGAGKAFGIDPLAGAAAGYGLGAVPEIVRAIRHRAKVAGSEQHSRNKEAGVGRAAPMTVSEYSGPLSFGRFKLTSGLPPFRVPELSRPQARSAGPASWMLGQDKTGASQATAMDSMTPAGRLRVTQRAGAPRVTGPAGPSIADISKPLGFGKKLSGALKNTL